jgi:putative SOS response-associated peptidase YedK
MCGRFALTVDPADLQEAFPEFTFPLQSAPRFNIAPTQPILALPNDGTNKADFFVWGLIPSWAKDPAIGSRLINARAETLVEKPSFRSAYKYRRCLIFADGFYEWQAQPGGKSKIQHFIRLKSGKPFAFAGLWEHWQSPDGSEVKSATIITTTPNKLVSPIHNRMPVILLRHAYTQWLDLSPQQPSGLQSLLVPYTAAEMEAYPVSPLVNSPGNDRPECIIAAEMQKPGF